MKTSDPKKAVASCIEEARKAMHSLQELREVLIDLEATLQESTTTPVDEHTAAAITIGETQP